MRSTLHFALLAAVSANSLRETLTQRSDLTTFVSLLDQFEAWQVFENLSPNVTVMVPNDAAYDKLLKMGLDLGAWPADFTVPILQYHFLKGRIENAVVPDESEPMLARTALTHPNMTQASPVKLFLESGEIYAQSGLQVTSKVVEPDVEFAGGVVHVLDASLVAPHNISGTLRMGRIAENFLQFMDETGLASEIESLHDATLFIPTDEAWQRSEAALATMDLEEKRALLRNHAVKGHVVYREGLSHSQTLTTVGGQPLEVTVDETGGILVQDAAVVQSDILWFNGIAHMTDKVIMIEQNNTLPAVAVMDQIQEFLAVPPIA